ncbi:hypothetical protein Dthio_PD2667 [Desulfonatronospira thiodismutans ASO3-1]|uniref:Uncharacterized protein n=1 Tax=Desulfonatronospira thiodismutans ASO3-1 TaxID=555779 RepID=D6SKP5_9BACT|nr:prepilin-type N-terminal cleavage/methylation domain-containing protein [Desulfonatronospira thiodismutans]EFI35256.1 hypothetical protein Dthio_PD2667 [Desulfonatronospira thiodismutans ASO3-1]
MIKHKLPGRRNAHMKVPGRSNRSGGSLGFTLIEMSVVLVVLGLLVGAFAPLIVSQLRQEKVSEAREVVRTARDEVVGFARMNQRLPTRSEFSTRIGHTIDPWNNELFYLPAAETTTEDENNESSALCQENSIQGLSLALPGRHDVEGVAFIIGSKGANQQSNTYFTSDDTNFTLITSRTDDGLDDEGVEGKVVIKRHGEEDQTGDKYDDLVEFVTLYYLNNRACP